MTQRQKIKETLPQKFLDPADLFQDKSLKAVSAYFKELAVRYAGRHVDFHTRMVGHDGAFELELIEERPETDAEMASRLQRDTAASRKAQLAAGRRSASKTQTEEAERKLYEKLHAKYGTPK